MISFKTNPRTKSVDPVSVLSSGLAAALLPAYDATRGRIGLGVWCWSCAVANEVGRLIADATGVPVGVRLSANAREESSAADVVFVLRAAVLPSGEELFIGLDEDAARAVLNALMTSLAGLRGDGLPTPVEHELLEYLALVCVDGLNRLIGPDGQALQISELESAENARATPVDGASWLVGTLTVGAARGRFYVSVPAELCDVPMPPSSVLDQSRWPRGAKCASIRVSLLLPPITVPQESWSSARVGDVLMTGAERLFERDSSVTMLADTGWNIGDAVISRRRRGHLTVQIRNLSPRPWSNERSREFVALHSVAAERKFSPAELLGWQVGGQLGFQLDSNARVAVRGPGDWQADCELVRLGKEIGLRMLRIVSGGDSD